MNLDHETSNDEMMSMDYENIESDDKDKNTMDNKEKNTKKKFKSDVVRETERMRPSRGDGEH